MTEAVGDTPADVNTPCEKPSGGDVPFDQKANYRTRGHRSDDRSIALDGTLPFFGDMILERFFLSDLSPECMARERR